MTKDELKMLLKNYAVLRDDCIRLRRTVEEKKKDILFLRGVVTDGQFVRGGDVSDGVERAVELIDGLIGLYTERIIQLEETQRQVLTLLDAVEDAIGRRILHAHYIEGVKFADIPNMLCISERSVWNYYSKALDEICRNTPS